MFFGSVVDLDLKSMASGLSAMVMAALGFLPAPIVVGALVDTTCRLWQTKPCGEKGFCLLYNTDEFRWKLHVFAGVVKALACLLDLVVRIRIRLNPSVRFVKRFSYLPSAMRGPGFRQFVGHATNPIFSHQMLFSAICCTKSKEDPKHFKTESLSTPLNFTVE